MLLSKLTTLKGDKNPAFSAGSQSFKHYFSSSTFSTPELSQPKASYLNTFHHLEAKPAWRHLSSLLFLIISLEPTFPRSHCWSEAALSIQYTGFVDTGEIRQSEIYFPKCKSRKLQLLSRQTHTALAIQQSGYELELVSTAAVFYHYLLMGN